MEKRILMIGNTAGLPGVPTDIRSYYSFFTSPAGGNWRHKEIEIVRNPTRRSLFEKLEKIENAKYYYVITIFSGHGGETDSGTVLAINGQGETIEMDDLLNLSRKQLLIFDCCRNYVDLSFDTELESTKLSISHDPIRQAYEDRIWDSVAQEIVLFACDQGEYTFDTPDGGEYSQCLLEATQLALTDSDSPFVSVGRAHFKAVLLMRRDNPSMQQHPLIMQPRRLMHQRLPWAINPDFYEIHDC